MASRQRSLTLYRLRERIRGTTVGDFDDFVKPEVLDPARVDIHELRFRDRIDARLYLVKAESKKPDWLTFLRDGFGEDIDLPEGANNRALLLVRLAGKDGAPSHFAFTFGHGRFLLRSGSWQRNFGLRVALNAIYEGDDRSNPLPIARLRRVDAKTVAENTLHSRFQTNRFATFDTFGLDVQRDLLGAVTGEPVSPELWGRRISGGDPLFLVARDSFEEVERVCRQAQDWHDRKDYQTRFAWVDHVRSVDVEELPKLESAVVMRLGERPQTTFELALPELVEWDEISAFRYSVDPSQSFVDLDIDDYLQLLSAKGTDVALTAEELRDHSVEALNENGEVVGNWSVFDCLDGEITTGTDLYLLAGGSFWEVAADYRAELDREISSIPEWPGALPDAVGDPDEGVYNDKAAGSSPDYLLLDKKTVVVNRRESPIEICDILTVDGCFVHVKRKLSSSALSHLFGQGAVSGDLLLMNRSFREATLEKITTAEKEKLESGKASRLGRFASFSSDAVIPNRHQIVYAVIAKWKQRTPAQGLPFFSKVNLRRHAEDLRRMGYQVAFKRIEVVTKPATKRPTKSAARAA